MSYRDWDKVTTSHSTISASSASDSLKRLLVFASAFAGVLYAPWIMFLRSTANGTPVLAAIQFMATDAFLYFTIARHSVGNAFYTADGLFPTNGFHPLWELLLTRLFGMPALVHDQAAQLLGVLAISTALVAFGIGLFSLVLYDLTKNFALSVVAVVPGLYYLVFSQVAPSYNSTWSYINGMESPLGIFWFGLLAYLTLNRKIFLRKGYVASVVMACLVALIIFSRLDDVFLLVSWLFLAFHFSDSRRDGLIRSLILGAIPVIALLLYAWYNYSYAGSFLPVSGLSKQGNSLLVNLLYSLSVFIPAAIIHSNPLWSEASMRVLQMCVPALLGVVTLVYWLKRLPRYSMEADPRKRYNRAVIAALCVYVVLKGAYNFLFVQLWGQGHWYYPLSIMVCNLVLAFTLAPRLKGISSGRKGAIINAAALGLVVLVANSFVSGKILQNYNTFYHDFWLRRSAIQQELQRIDPGLRIIEYDDGPISYALDIPTMNGLGFILDAEGARARASGRLLQLAYERGFRVIGLLNYYAPLPVDVRTNPDGARVALETVPRLEAEDLSRWKFRVLYQDPGSRALFIAFEPVPSHVGSPPRR